MLASIRTLSYLLCVDDRTQEVAHQAIQMKNLACFPITEIIAGKSLSLIPARADSRSDQCPAADEILIKTQAS